MYRNFNRLRHYSSGSDGSDVDYGYSHAPCMVQDIQQASGDTCIRCSKKVYQTEKVEIGVVMHKNCFKCAKCSVTLTLNSFVLARATERGPKDVYCKPHTPKPVSRARDNDSVDIRNAMNAQKMNRNLFQMNQVRLAPGSEHWQLDPKAMVFEHCKELHERNRLRRPATHDRVADDVDYESGLLIQRLRSGQSEKAGVRELAQALQHSRSQWSQQQAGAGAGGAAGGGFPQREHKFPVNSDYMEPNALWSPNAVEDPWHPSFLGRAADKTATVSSGHDSGFNEPIYAPLPGPSSARPRDRPAVPPDAYYDAGAGYGQYNGNGERIYESLNNVLRHEGAAAAAPPPPPLPAHLPPHTLPHAGAGGPMYHPDRYHDRGAPHPDLYRQDSGGRPGGHVKGGRLPPPQPGGMDPAHKTYLRDQAFMAQQSLEWKQHSEHRDMERDIEMLKEQEVEQLERDMRQEMDKAVSDLFMQMDSGTFQGDLNVEKMHIEQHFHRMKEERMRNLLDRLNNQQRMQLDDMIDKHTHEMLTLIDKKVPMKLPDAKVPKKKKSQLYAGPEAFDDVDFVAMQVAQEDHGSVSETVYELTKNCRNNLEKARAIFRWITFKNLNEMIFLESLPEDSPYYFLKGIKHGLESYHELFKRLCSYAGLPVKIIYGISKCAGYKPGSTATSQFRNKWAAVFIDDTWRLIDCHWASRHIKEPSDIMDHNFTYDYDEFFFLPDPEEMIYFHFPDDPEWQLLDKPRTLEQFISLPTIKSTFFSMGFKVPKTATSVIESQDGQVEVVLKMTRQLPLVFKTRLEQDGETIDGYCIHEVTEKEVIFNLGLPSKGVFYLTVFACDKDRGPIFHNIMCYRIKCLKVVNKPFSKFPDMPDGYGPMPLWKEFGMSTEKRSEYYLVANEDKMLLTVKYRTPLRIAHMLFLGSKDGGEGTNTQMDCYAFPRFVDGSQASWVIRFPERGIYMFSLFAGRRSSDEPLEACCHYLIQCNAKTPAVPPLMYPRVSGTAQWYRCRLHEPPKRDLKVNRNIKFKLEAPEADEVAIILRSQWTYLKREEGNSKAIFSGTVNTGTTPKGTLDVYMRPKTSAREFVNLLEYQIVPED